jgi:Ca2+-binding RTX toxin-like protein
VNDLGLSRPELGAEPIFGDVHAGHDRLYGGAGADDLYGESNHILSEVIAGNDRLYGGAGNDRLVGDAGEAGARFSGDQSVMVNDFLSGGAGDDILFGDSGVLGITSRGGNDHLHGGEGADIFAVGGGLTDEGEWLGLDGFFGVDTIHDFRQGEDRIRFDRYGDLAFDDLAIVEGDGGISIIVPDQGEIRLNGFTGTLTALDVIFTANEWIF